MVIRLSYDKRNELNYSRMMNHIDNITKNIDIRNYQNADYQYEILCKCIKNFQDNLDNEHEVGLLLASFGQSVLLNISNIGYSNPCLIHFYGTYNGLETHLIQHISQLNFLLTAVPKQNPDKPAKRISIGFDTTSS